MSSDFPRVTQIEPQRAGIQTGVCLSPKFKAPCDAYGRGDPAVQGILRTSCSVSTLQVCDLLPFSGLQFPHLENREMETQWLEGPSLP